MTQNSGQFKPGQSGNPNGRPRLPEDIKAIKRLSPAYIKAIIAKLSRMSPDDMQRFVELRLGNNMEMMVASIIVRAITDGDHNKLNFLLDRTIGKVVEERNVRIEPVVYKTSIRGDGALVQEVLTEVIGETDGEKE